MTIYRLNINEVADTPSIISGSFRAERTIKKSIYFSTLELAENRKKEIQTGLDTLIGFLPKVEITIETIGVIE